VEEGLIAKTINREHDSIGYQPGVYPDELTVHKIIKAMEEKGAAEVPVKDGLELRRIKKILDEYDKMADKSPLNAKIEDLS